MTEQIFTYYLAIKIHTMKFKTFFTIALLSLFVSCSEQQKDSPYYATEIEESNLDTTLIGNVYSAEELTELAKTYKGETYWTITGDYETKNAALPQPQITRIVASRIHWSLLAFYGPDGVLGVMFHKTPISGSVDYHPYYDLPVLTKKDKRE